MTIGFRSNLVDNFGKTTICSRSVYFLDMCASLVKAKILQKRQFLKDIFMFLAKGYHFQKYSFLVDILIFLNEVSSFFEKGRFLVSQVSFGKKCHFMQKALGFEQISEYLSTVIKSYCANFGVKGQVFFSTSILVQKCQFSVKEKN